MSRRDEVRAFALRDRKEVDASRRAHWVRRFRAEGPAATFAAAQALLVHARRVCPGWPDERERAADLREHLRVAALLDRAARALARR